MWRPQHAARRLVARAYFSTATPASTPATSSSAQPSSFVSRFKQRMVESFEDKKESLLKQEGEKYEKRLLDILLATPKKQFNFKSLRDFYSTLRQDLESQSGPIKSKTEQFEQAMDQVKRIIKIMDGFSEFELQYPILIRAKQIKKVADKNLCEVNEVKEFVETSNNIILMHTWLSERKEKGLPVPEKFQEIQQQMIQERPRPPPRQGGARRYVSRAAPF